MTATRTLRWITIPLVALGLTTLAAPAEAKAPVPIPPTPPTTFDAGQACEFPLTYSGTGGFTTTHKHGDVTVTAGQGQTLTLTNATSGKSTTLPSSGVVDITTKLPDGSTRVVALGAHVLILFPTDVPAGPTTTLYKGKVVYTIGADGVWTILSSAGPTKDLCAALS